MAVEIISAQRLRELLNYDPATGVFTWRVALSHRCKIGGVAGCTSGIGRKYIRIEGRLYFAHRLAWLHVYGEWPSKVIDHINGDHGDNRIANLRDVTRSENNHNLHGLSSHNASGITGVSWDSTRNKWAVGIKINGKRIGIGRFDDLSDAVAARNAAKLKYHPTCPSS